MKFILALVAFSSALSWDADFPDDADEYGLCERSGDDYATEAGDCDDEDHFCCYVWGEDDPWWTSEYVEYTNEANANTYCFNTEDWADEGSFIQSTTQDDRYQGNAGVIQATANGEDSLVGGNYIDCNNAVALAAGASVMALATLF